MDIYWLLFTTVFLTNFLIVATYRSKAQRGERFDWKKEGVWLALPLRFAGLCGLAYLLAYIVYPRAVAWSLVESPPLLRWAGAIYGLAVSPFAIAWTQRTLERNVSPTVVTRREHSLVVSGPYRYIRHPLYTAGILLYLSLAAISGSWFILILLAFGVVFILIRLPKEEAELAARFGNEYEAYRAATGRFVPRMVRR